MTASTRRVRFLFDPACPWAWRTSLWIREVTKARAVDVEWELLSLAYINRERMNEAARARAQQRQPVLRLLARAKETAGNTGIDQLYLALGTAAHIRKARLEDPAVLESALAEADLPTDLLKEARTNPTLDTAIETASARAIDDGAFGVPTLYIDGSNTPYFGPVIDTVPTGEEAGELWDHLVWIVQRPYFYELKRSRQ